MDTLKSRFKQLAFKKLRLHSVPPSPPSCSVCIEVFGQPAGTPYIWVGAALVGCDAACWCSAARAGGGVPARSASVSTASPVA